MDVKAVRKSLFKLLYSLKKVQRESYDLLLILPVQEKESASLMLEHFGLEDEAAELHKAIRSTTKKGILTRDLGGNYDTEDVT